MKLERRAVLHDTRIRQSSSRFPQPTFWYYNCGLTYEDFEVAQQIYIEFLWITWFQLRRDVLEALKVNK